MLGVWAGTNHTPSTVFRHLPPNSAGFGYAATEGALFISGTNNYDCRSNLAPKHARKHEAHPPRVKKKKKKKKKSSVSIQTIVVLFELA